MLSLGLIYKGWIYLGSDQTLGGLPNVYPVFSEGARTTNWGS